MVLTVLANSKRRLCFGFSACLILSGAAKCPAAHVDPVAAGVTPPPAATGMKLGFSDDFNTLSLSPNGTGAYNWYKGIWFESAPSSSFITVANSTLTLTWQRQHGNDTSITTYARDGSQGHTWREGYFEARMKWSPVNGAWPAFWMLPKQAINNKASEGGELDIFEGAGSAPQIFYGSAHDWKNYGQTEAWSNSPDWYILARGNDFSQWHTYGCLRTPGHAAWYFDNKLVLTSSLPKIFDTEDYYIILGMQEGANWTYGNLQGVTATQMTLQVDWVRVWQ